MSLNKGSLNKAIRLLKVKQLEIENQGAGANPILSADASANILKTSGHYLVYSDLSIQSATLYLAKLQHNMTADREITIPDKSFTLADNADIDELNAQNLIGAANKKYMNTNFYGEETSGSFRYDVEEEKITNVHTSTVNIAFNLGLTTNKGTKKLYVDSARMRVTDADENSKINGYKISGINADGLEFTIDLDVI
ncbi:unnamed protein product, partial [marine sediment metagenome]